jgi:hypothetical protein
LEDSQPSLLGYYVLDMKRPTLAILACRALTAVLTVWCLGCSAYDPLIDALTGAGRSPMSCGSEMGAPAATGTAAIAASAAASTQGFNCGCVSCTGASPQTLAFALTESASPTAELPAIALWTSITRAPVAPPPELRTL